MGSLSGSSVACLGVLSSGVNSVCWLNIAAYGIEDCLVDIAVKIITLTRSFDRVKEGILLQGFCAGL